MRILLILIISVFFLFSCKNKSSVQQPLPIMDKTASVTTEKKEPAGKWKIIEWYDPKKSMTEAEKKQVMNVAGIEITTDGRFINHSEGNPDAISTYQYFENTRTINIVTPSGGTQSYQVSFNENRMTLKGKDNTMVLER